MPDIQFTSILYIKSMNSFNTILIYYTKEANSFINCILLMAKDLLSGRSSIITPTENQFVLIVNFIQKNGD
jgi:hypothetical protein